MGTVQPARDACGISLVPIPPAQREGVSKPVFVFVAQDAKGSLAKSMAVWGADLVHGAQPASWLEVALELRDVLIEEFVRARAVIQ